MGIDPRHAPLWVWPTMTSTLSTSTSFLTALTASPGVPLLSAKKTSTLRPMMPPLAFTSSTAMVAPHITPSPVMADGPLIADENPTLIGWAHAGPAASRASQHDVDDFHLTLLAATLSPQGRGQGEGWSRVFRMPANLTR